MKKILLSVCAMFAALSLGFAQDVNEATDLYNEGATALNLGDKAGALGYFQKAYEIASACGEAGEELVANCKSIIPSLALSLAKDEIKANNFDSAVAKLGDAVKLAGEFGDEGAASEAQALIPQAYMQKGNSLLKSNDFAGAAAVYEQVLALDADNSRAALYLGQAYDKAGNEDKAVKAYELASSLGQEKAAGKQLSKMFLKKANAANKAKKFDEALEAATKSNSYVESAEAYYIVAIANQNLGKIEDAIGGFEKYINLKPNARNASAVKFTIAALYQGQKNNSKALEYYNQLTGDATYGAQALQQIKALSK